MPLVFGDRLTTLACAEFMALYPEIELDVLLDDRYVNLVEEGFDLSLRATTTLEDSNLTADHFKRHRAWKP